MRHNTIYKIRNNFQRSDYEWFVKTEGKQEWYGEKYTFDTIRAMSWISDASFVKDFLDRIENPPMFKFACNTFLTQHKLSLVFNRMFDDIVDKSRSKPFHRNATLTYIESMMNVLITAKSKGMDFVASNWSTISRFDGFWWDGTIHKSRCKYIQEKVFDTR